jgi:glutaminyl-peptide cyclotransferase
MEQKLKLLRSVSYLAAFTMLIVCSACSCNSPSPKKEAADNKTEIPLPPAPVFNPDSAYAFTQAQCDFGPRVPNTKAHDACADYLTAKIKNYTPAVIVQKGTVKTFDNVKLNISNIIASFNPENKNRILLFAHWDSRPWADQDTIDKNKPILAADDGASGVAILLEVARQLSSNKASVGVDIIFFDAEDWGTRASDGPDNDSYALGTQYWAKNPHVAGYSAMYGILLDMTGAKNAKFFLEGNSMHFASGVVRKVWDIANQSGFSDYFIYKETGFITDDHLYVNQLINIPSIDIIHTDADGRFASHWHTHHDVMDVIDRNTLRAVGQTLLEVIFRETGV